MRKTANFLCGNSSWMCSPLSIQGFGGDQDQLHEQNDEVIKNSSEF